MIPESLETAVLAGDIGGTKTNIGLFRRGAGRPVPEVLETYRNREHSCLEDVVDRFLGQHRLSFSAACFGIAGPVLQGRSKATNLAWTVSEQGLARHLGCEKVSLLNDLAATARGIPGLTAGETVALNRAPAVTGAPVGLVAPGTGLGQALLVFGPGDPVPVASEGGHVDFAPTNDLEMLLWQTLRQKYGHVSVERVASGPGLAEIYAFLKQSGDLDEPPWLAERLDREDAPKVISEVGLRDEHPLCVKALDMFCLVLAKVSGNLALTALTRGGLYLGGGIPPKILPKLREEAFLLAFCSKGRFQSLLETIPVRVITNERTALLGAAMQALSM